MKNMNYHKNISPNLGPGDVRESLTERGQNCEEKRRRSAKWKKWSRGKERERNSKQERRKRWKKAPCQALETVIHGDHLS